MPDTAREKAIATLVGRRSEIYAKRYVLDEAGNRKDIFPTAVTADVGRLLQRLVVQEGARTCMETGLAFALSTMWICDGLLRNDVSSHHVAIDAYQTSYWKRAGTIAIESAGIDDIVEIIEEDSALILPQFALGGRRFDIIFIDGNHLFEGVLLDLVFSGRLVRSGGLVIIDDIWLPAVRRAVAFAVNNLRWTIETTYHSRVAVARVPEAAAARSWDDYHDF